MFGPLFLCRLPKIMPTNLGFSLTDTICCYLSSVAFFEQLWRPLPDSAIRKCVKFPETFYNYRHTLIA